MKIKFNLLVAAGILISFSFVQFSCSSSKKSAVSCPDFSHSRNMKGRHAQLNNTYQDHQERYRAYSSRFLQVKNLTSRRYTVSESGQTDIIHNSDRIFSTYMQPARVQLAGMVIPLRKFQTRASAAESDIPASLKSTSTGLPGCDSIVMRNGDIMEAKVVEIGQRDIRYRKCGDSEGPVFVVNLADVFMIKYPNGTRDYFTSERSPAPSMGGTAPKKTDGMAVAGFIGSLAGLFIAGIPLGIMAVVFGFISLGKIKRHPDRYKGRGFGIASIIIGFIDVVGMLIILANS